jgi:hypothetical protein
MRAHRKAVERCRHRPFWRALAAFGIDPTGHGWQGWLPVEKAVPRRALGEAMLIRSILWSALVDLGRGKDWLGKLRVFLTDWGDPNDARRNDREQLCYAPLATLRHSRRGTRERLIEVRERHRDRLRIETDCLATRILFDAAGRASGVAWRKGRHLYRAGPDPNPAAGEPGEARARREVILAGNSSNAGLGSGVWGISPWASGTPLDNVIAFAFAAEIGNSVDNLCWTAAQQFGTLYGLDHEYYCPDINSYLSGCGTKCFTNFAASCCEFSARTCDTTGQPATQNSAARMSAVPGKSVVIFRDNFDPGPSP